MPVACTPAARSNARPTTRWLSPILQPTLTRITSTPASPPASGLGILQFAATPVMMPGFRHTTRRHPPRRSQRKPYPRTSVPTIRSWHSYSASASNPCENAIRPFVVGKRNLLFCDTLAGANASAILYSLVETCKASDVDPYQYLVALFMALPHAQTATTTRLYYPEGSSPQPSRGYRRLPQGTSSRPLTLNA